MHPVTLGSDDYIKTLRKQSTTQLLKRWTSLLDSAEFKALGDDVRNVYTALSLTPSNREDLINALSDVHEELTASSSTSAVTIVPTMTTNAEVTALLAELDSHTIEYHRGRFPVHFNDDETFTFLDGFTANIHEVGAGYLSERLKDIPYATWTRAKREGNKQLNALIQANSSRLEVMPYVMPVLDGQVLAFMREYNPYSHHALLADLEEETKLWQLTYWTFDTYQLSMYFTTHIVGPLSIGLLITNGHSGHSAMSFRFFIRNPDSGWEVKLNAADFYPEGAVTKRRHLSKLDDVKVGLREAFKNVSALAFDALLEQPATILTDLMQGLSYLTTRQEYLLQDILNEVEGLGIRTIADVLNYITPFYSTRGYAATVAGLVDRPLAEAVSNWRKATV